MNAERRQRIKDLFHEAVQVAPQRRTAWLREHCPDDAELVEEVRSLLHAHRDGDSFIEPPDFDAVSRLLRDDKPETLVGRRIGPYELTRLIGAGGMANVFLARRADGQFERQVAVKLIKRGMDTDEIVRRFRRERQTLAALDHPNIATLIDGGLTDDGRPYLIMEFVDGAPLDGYCSFHALTLRQRLELFRTICGAVHYAHQNLVVHRDLKPGNILVTREGVPKLLDFGIAKLLDLADEDALTRTGSTVRLMTPDYASPEQVRRGRVTITTDVYALGVILYELLTGRRPYRLNGHTQRALERAICEEPPTRPSTAASEPVDADDATGLRSGSSNRAPSRTRPLKARGGRGNEPASAEPGAGESPAPQRVQRAATRAATRAARPQHLRRQLAGDLDNIILTALRKEPQRRYASVRDFSEDIRRHLEGLPVQARRDTLGYRAAKFVRRNRAAVGAVIVVFGVLVAALMTTTWQADRLARQRDVAERHLRRALEAEQQTGELARRATAEAESAREVTEFLVGLFKSADPSESGGQDLTARQMLERGAAHIETELAHQPAIQATLFGAIGRVYQNLADFAAAERFLERALQVSEQAFGAEALETASRLAELGVLRVAQGRYDDADALHNRALAIRRERLPADHPDVATSLSNLGSLRRDQGRFAEASDLLGQALAIRRQVRGDQHPEVLASLNNLAGVYYALGDYERARQNLEELVAAIRRTAGGETADLALYLNNLGLIIHTQGDYAEARRYYAESLAMRRKLLGDEHPDVATSLNNLGGLAIDSGDPAAAEPYFRESLAIYLRKHGTDHPYTANIMNNLGLCLRLLGRNEEARQKLEDGLAARRRIVPAEHPTISSSLLELGELELVEGRPAEAETLVRQCLDIRQKALPAEHWQIAEARSVLGACLTAQGQLQEAAPLLHDAYPTIRDARGQNNFKTHEAARRIQAWEAANPAAP